MRGYYKNKRPYIFCLFLLIIPIVYGATDEIFLQGVLRNATNNSLIDDTVTINISIWDGGVQVFTDSVASQKIDDGVYHVVFDNLNNKSLFLENDLTFRLGVGTEYFSSQELVPVPQCHASFISNNSLFLQGLPGTSYIEYNMTSDFTTAGFVLGPHTNLSPSDILSWVGNYSNAVLTNDTDTDTWNMTSDMIKALGPHTNVTPADILAWVGNYSNAVLNNGSGGAGNCSGTNCDIGWGNLTSVPVGFADGTDDTGSGADYSKIQNQSTHNCDTDTVAIGRSANGTFICTADLDTDTYNMTSDFTTAGFYLGPHVTNSTIEITESQISDLSHTTDTYNMTSDITAAGFVLGVHVTNATIEITESQISDLSHTTDTYNMTSDIVAAGFVAGPSTNLTEDNVEAYIFDDDNTANLNLSAWNITNVNCIQFTGGGEICTA